MPAARLFRHSRNTFMRFLSANSMTMTSSPRIHSTRSIDNKKGWRSDLMCWMALSSATAGAASVCTWQRSPSTNLIALNRPPGASHFQTSPKPPRPKGSSRRYPGIGSRLRFLVFSIRWSLRKRSDVLQRGLQLYQTLDRGEEGSKPEGSACFGRANLLPNRGVLLECYPTATVSVPRAEEEFQTILRDRPAFASVSRVARGIGPDDRHGKTG